MKKTFVVMSRLLIAVAIVALAAFGFMGCNSKTPDSLTITENVAKNPGVVFGKIIDRQTRQGIVGATVKLKVNGSWRATTTAGASDSGLTDTAGDFTFTDLPVNSAMALVATVSMQPALASSAATTAYVPATMSVNIPTTTTLANNQASLDLGQIAMEPGVVVTVRVVDAKTGAFVSKASGTLSIYENPITMSTLDLLATQDATDHNKYTIIAPQTGTTMLFVPAVDVNGDGRYDYTATSYMLSMVGGVISGQGDRTTVIAMNPVSDSTILGFVASNIRTYGDTAGGANTLSMIGASDPVNVFFNMPVTVDAAGADSVTLSYTDNFKNLTTGALVAEQAVTVTQGADNCLLTVTPSAALIAGKSYTLKGIVRSTPNNSNNSPIFDLTTVGFMVKPSTTSTILTAAGAITLDNMNFFNNGNVITAGSNTTEVAGALRMIFPEPVWGQARLVSKNTGTTTVTVMNGSPVTITGQSMVWSNPTTTTTQPAFGNTVGTSRSGALFVWSASALDGGTYLDNTATRPEVFRIGLDVYDADGNTYGAETDFTVQ